MIGPSNTAAQLRQERSRATELWVQRCLARTEECRNDPEALVELYDLLKAAWPRICASELTGAADLQRFCDVVLPLMNLTGDWDWAVTTLEAALARTDQKEWPGGKSWLSWFYELTARYRDAHAAALDALASATRLDDPAARCEALCRLAKSHRTQGEYRQALSFYAEAQVAGEQAGDGTLLASVFNSSGLTHWHLGNFENALSSLGRALELAEAVGDLRRQAQVFNNLGLVLMFLGAYEEALGRLQSGLKIAEAIDDQREIGVICGNLGEVQLYRGDLERALFHQQQAHERAVRMGSPYRTAKALVRLSRTWRELKTAEAVSRAAELARQAAEIGVEKGLHHFEILGYSYEAMAHLSLRQRQTAVALSRQAVDMLGRHESFDGSRAEILFNHFLIVKEESPAEASQALRDAHDALMADAGRIQDAATRQCFLTGIELNRAIVDAANLANVTRRASLSMKSRNVLSGVTREQ